MKSETVQKLGKIWFFGSVVFLAVAVGVVFGAWRSADFMWLYGNAVTALNDVSKNPLLVDRRYKTKSGFVRYTDYVDNGYLLASGYFLDDGRTEVRLVDLKDGHIVKRWHPDPAAIRAASNFKHFTEVSRFQPQSPILMPDGGLVFIDDEGPLVRIDACSKITWIVDEYFHHSLERDLDGNFIVSGMGGPLEKPYDKIENDMVIRVTPDGKVIDHHPLTKILIDNGYIGVLHTAFPRTRDPLHLNDVEVARTTTANWQRGDWLISMRHLNAVMIVRPPSMKVVWLQVGPWLEQHDADFLNDGRISVFGNDVVEMKPTIFLHGHSQIYVMDPATRTVTTPYAKTVKDVNMGTHTQGRQDIQPNGDVFVEETDFGRLLRLNNKGLVWSYYIADDKHSAHLFWSRYLSKAEIDRVDLSRKCPG